jgi:ABC-2 type transport system ATP-binding protein
MSAARSPERHAAQAVVTSADGADRNAREPAVIDVRGLTKSFGGRKVVDDVSLRVPRGRIQGFLGPNGSGKTTTIRMLCGLLTPDAGEGTCLGYDLIREAARIKREVGYMTQKFSYYEDLSIEENLEFVARVYAIPDRRATVAHTLDRLGLANRRKQLAGSLSGGWKQRLALAACLLHAPKLLLLDEPTAGVDPGARRDFWAELHALAAEGMTVLVSTHYMDEAERCHALTYIAYGKLLVTGTAREVIEHSGLATYVVSAPAGGEHALARLSRQLAGQPGVDTIVPFGTTLHVSGTDHDALERTREAFSGQLSWSRSEPWLDDVFVRLMQQARDNFA